MIHSMHIIGSRQMGGAEKFYMRLVHALHRRGFNVLAVNRPSSPLKESLEKTVPRQNVSMHNGWDLFSMIKIRGLIRRYKPLIVQTYMGRATRLTRLPRGSSTTHVARLGGFYKVNGYYRHAHAWVANTRALCDYLIREGLDADRVYRIGNFVEIANTPDENTLRALRKSLQIATDAVVLFSLGRLIDIKGFDDLLAAFAQIPRDLNGRPLVLVIAGDGPLRKPLHRQARQLSVTDRLRWVGWQKDPGTYFDLADIFVCPSHRETLGNVILEAWAHKLPVVATRTLGASELIVAEKNGLLAEIRNPIALAATITRLLEAGPKTWRNLGENGLSTVKQHHTEEVVLSSYLALYADLQPGFTD